MTNEEEKIEAIIENRIIINDIMSYIASFNIQNPAYSEIRNILEYYYIQKVSEENKWTTI